tara:strand:- start:812 stop:1249 length:438 start_codon:yes stop_codon:yes gene_type:complete
MKQIIPKDAFRKITPYSFVFVISHDKGKPNGMVAAWYMKCSYDPPLMIVSLSKRGHTQKLIRESKEFVIAVPNKDLVKEVEFFGSNHGWEVDKFKETGVEIVPASVVKSPLLAEATLNFELQLEKEVDVGDHYIFIGKGCCSSLQ